MSEPRDRARASDEAAAWHARLGRQAVTTEELRDFRRWRAQPANAAAYAHLERTWTQAGALRHDPEILSATQAALQRRRRRKAAGRTPLILGAGLAALATAALIVALLLGGGLPRSYDTGVGEQRLIVLNDGSRLRLNTDSKVRVRYARDARTLELLRGEAFFEVAHDPSRPFTVEAGEADVRALGTKFDVRRFADGVQVTLVEGSVRVQAEDRPAAWTLKPHEQLTIAKGLAAAPRPADPAQATSWTDGRIVFASTPLAAAVAEVNRYATRKVELDVPALARAPVNGVFDTGDTEAFVAAVTTLFDLEADRTPHGAIRLRGGAPAPAARKILEGA